MRIILEPEVTTSKKSFFAYPYYTFNGQISPTKYFKIPLLQRDYVWPKEESVKESIIGLVNESEINKAEMMSLIELFAYITNTQKDNIHQINNIEKK